MQQILGGIALISTVLALFVRRTSVTCRWEGCPTLIVAAAGGGFFLMSPLASRLFGAQLHDLTTLWNVEDLLGHLLLLTCSASMLRLTLTRFGSQAVLDSYSLKFIRIPLLFIVPALLCLFAMSMGSDKYFDDFDEAGASFGTYPYLETYWLVLCLTFLYFTIFAARNLILLRDEPSLTSDMYFVTCLVSVAFMIALTAHAATACDFCEVVWCLGYISLLGWAATPMVAWRQRTRALRNASKVLVSA